MTITSYKIRSKVLKRLGYRNYATYLAGDHWKKRRATYEATHERRCRYCNELAQDLHHRTYRNLGDEADDDLEWVCRDHHEEVQKYGVVKPVSDPQKAILREHGYSEAMVTTITMGVAYKLIGELSRGEVRSPRETAA